MSSPLNVIRKNYSSTPPERRLSREREAQEMLAALEKTVATTNDQENRNRTKRLFLIQGDAGIGKSWFMAYLQETIQARQPKWIVGANIYAAEHFVTPSSNYHALTVLQDCANVLKLGTLGALPVANEATIEQVLAWAGKLEEDLNKLQSGPLLLFFDDLECWVGVGGSQRNSLNFFLRVVWQMLLRKAHLPCMIICAARRPPPFSNPLLRLSLTSYELEGFPADQLERLVEYSDAAQLRPFIELNARGNPWTTQLLDAELSPQPEQVHQKARRERIRERIFRRIVDDRLDDSLAPVLYKLAKHRPDGFQPEDPLLPEGHTTLTKLIDASFVDFDLRTRRYSIAPVLAALFKESA